jgi:hypothetical protein
MHEPRAIVSSKVNKRRVGALGLALARRQAERKFLHPQLRRPFFRIGTLGAIP